MVFIPSTCSRITSRITSRVSSRIWRGAIWRVHHLRANSEVRLSHMSSVWPWSGTPKVRLYNTFLGSLRQKLILGHNEMNYGTEQGKIFWDRRSWLMVITRPILGLKKVFFWDRRSQFQVLTRWIMGHSNVTFCDRRSWYWVIIRWIMGLNDVTFWDRRSWYWVITRWIMGQNKVALGDTGKVILVYIGRWSYGRFWDDDKVFPKMKMT